MFGLPERSEQVEGLREVLGILVDEQKADAGFFPDR